MVSPDSPTLADLLGTDDPTQQVQQVRDLLMRVQLPPVVITVSFDPFTREAHIAGLSSPISDDGIQLALSSALASVAQQRIQQQAQQAQATPAKTLRGKRGAK